MKMQTVSEVMKAVREMMSSPSLSLMHDSPVAVGCAPASVLGSMYFVDNMLQIRVEVVKGVLDR